MIFYEIKCNRITSFHGIHDIHVDFEILHLIFFSLSPCHLEIMQCVACLRLLKFLIKLIHRDTQQGLNEHKFVKSPPRKTSNRGRLGLMRFQICLRKDTSNAATTQCLIVVGGGDGSRKLWGWGGSDPLWKIPLFFFYF